MTAPENMDGCAVDRFRRLFRHGPVVAVAKYLNGGRATIYQAVERVGGWRPGGGLWLPFRESELEIVRAVAAEGGWSVDVVDGVAFVIGKEQR